MHSPLEVPPSFYEKFAFMEESDKPTHERQTYHAMVDFADQAIGNFTAAIRAKNMWDDIVIVFSADSACTIAEPAHAVAERSGVLSMLPAAVNSRAWCAAAAAAAAAAACPPACLLTM